MGKRMPKLYLMDILESARRIEDYIGDLSFEEFEKDKKTIDAVVRNFEILGEASNNVPEDLKAKHPDVPWKQMIGMRNILAHEYYEVAMRVVWDTIKQNIPQVKILIKKVLDDLQE